MQHDLFWPTIAQAIGSGILIVATGGLVWATFALVSATKVLARVGEDTWKSQVQPVVWLLLKCGVLSDSSFATVQAKNGCAVGVTDVNINIVVGSYAIQANHSPVVLEFKEEISKTIELSAIDSNSTSAAHQIWDVIRESLEFAANNPAASVGTVIGGLSVFLNYRHSITGETFSITSRFTVEDMHRGSVKVTELEKREPRRV